MLYRNHKTETQKIVFRQKKLYTTKTMVRLVFLYGIEAAHLTNLERFLKIERRTLTRLHGSRKIKARYRQY